MNTIKTLADNRPVVFVFSMLLMWVLLGVVLVFGSAAVLHVPFINVIPQTVGLLGAILILLAIVGKDGLVTCDRDHLFWQLAGLVDHFASACLYSYRLYGMVSSVKSISTFGIFARSSVARSLLVRQGIVGFVEESLFRGIILYALVRVWG